jgi:cysteine desulfurase
MALAHAQTLICSRIEHPSVTAVAEARAANGAFVHWLPVTPHGQIDVADLERVLGSLADPLGACVAVMAVNHETGVLQPLAEVARCVQRYRARLHVDAVQLLGKGDWALSEHADSVAVAAHKIGGPKGIGALLFRGTAPRAVLLGGAQERGLRPGTQDALAALGFGVAFEHSLQRVAARAGALAPLRDRLEARLGSVSEVNGLGAPRLAHVSNLSFRGASGPELVAALDLEGVRTSSGSACSAGTPEPSVAIRAMLGAARAASAVRFSLGATTSNRDIDGALGAIGRVLGVTL